MKRIHQWLGIGLAATLVSSALLLFSFRPEEEQQATLMQKFEVVAQAYLSQHYQKTLAGTQRTLLTNGALDSKVTQIVNASCPKKQAHYNFVLSKYKNAPFRAALLVTGAPAPAPSEFLMFSLPSNWRVAYYLTMTNFSVFASPAVCDSFRTIEGTKKPAGGSGGFSVFAAEFDATDTECVCTSECNNEADSGSCPNC